MEWPQPSNRNWWTWNWNLVLFTKTVSCSIPLRLPHQSKHMFSGTKGLDGWVAANILKCNLFPYRYQYGSQWWITLKFSKVTDYEIEKNSLDHTCPFLLSTEYNLEYPKDLSHQFPCIWLSTLAVIGYADSWRAFTIWSLTVSTTNNSPLPLWSLITRGVGWQYT